MTKLVDRAQHSKLSSIQQIDSIQYNESIVRQTNFKEYPRSYRLDQCTLDILKGTQNRISSASGKKISESRLIKALILHSKDLSNDRLIKVLKDIL
ncbi:MULTISPECIES: hypothetical protein [spotted fever group]|uniref:Uncharacterized protein n=1 Tax=Rickettsia tamurae subsp. buchneri TaxID=1462938 RepID=A0A8E1BZA1_9RICK|nr:MULTISPECIES: hypothetical protein [spotted fever group]EER20747.1 hypothetical protein REIS_2257 [Rickettsia endosymbiont of Ixodes scapularis]KDO02108.1 hypothetical protein REISMN_08625 [Rickettsia tamurae subsp. buchneri]HJD66836.1 hypothetical protein [Rickettsia endosymbiont of Bembidion nr. Transversale]